MTVSRLCGLDLGQKNDYTAFSVLERDGRDYQLRYLERFKLGMPYPQQVRRVAELMGRPELRAADLIVDVTGVGAPVGNMIVEAGLSPVQVTITGGNTVTGNGMEWGVPKRDLVMAALVLLEGGRLKFAKRLPEAEVFQKELLAMRVKINLKTAHDSYEAHREGDHDDLVLSVALGCWYGEHGGALPFSWMS